jgi:catechol 2,3-dioxygenase-like lactoylglutathione lyase family enzyme
MAIGGIDHVAITSRDLPAACAFYMELFDGRALGELIEGDQILVRSLQIGGAVINIHQLGNGIDLVAAQPVPGSTDICFGWDGPIDSAIALLEARGIPIIEGPVARANRLGEASHSVYFRDPDGNLLELMAAE